MNDNLKKWLPWIAVAAVALIVIVIIAVNSGGDDEAAATTTTAGQTTTTAVEETTTTTVAETTTTTEAGGGAPEAGPLGAVTVAPGEDIQIRSVEAISGDVAFLGVPNQRGTELAITDYGPIKGHNVTIGTPLDDLCSAEGGQAAGQTVASDEQVVGVIGTSCSGAATAMSPLISQAGMVMISPSNTSPALTSDLAGTPGENYNPGYYRTAHNDLFQGAAVAEFVFNQLKLTKAAAIHDGDPYTNGLATAFKNAFEKLGGEIVAFTAVNKGDTDMTGVLTEVAQAGPEVIYFPIFMPEGGFIAQQVGAVAGLENVVLIGADGLLTDNFMELKATEGMYFSGPNLDYGNNKSEIGTTAADFLAEYQAAYGEAPSAAFWAHSYDATVLLLSAIEKVSVELDDGSLFIDRQALRDELTSTKNFSGIIGTLSCDQFGDCGAQRISIVLHEDSSDIEKGKSNIVFEYSPGG
ncbi:MAG: branched-chain amino acid ABC transporter substrate-binding protein [Acidimicrobiia bacterium]|nr:MAG: branched-chain amino acid ABC transporter substrate-binding protein [Acidimicrobiia bacterium]